jgi:hypothetical protein
MKWAFRSLVTLGAIVSILASNWTALCWILAALLQHERAEMLRGSR